MIQNYLITFSWDSMGCESGIVLRESVEREDASRDLIDSTTDDEDLNGDLAATPVQRLVFFLFPMVFCFKKHFFKKFQKRLIYFGL